MGSRGRTSSAELTLIGPGGVETVRRPAPPSELGPEEQAEWREICAGLPANYFPRETWGMLCQLCRHRVRAKRLAQWITRLESSDEFNPREYFGLLTAEEVQSRAIASISVKLRLTHSTVIDRRQRRPPSTQQPWD